LASRLQGDFRTGKRLNMRKIIPYIASDFRKVGWCKLESVLKAPDCSAWM
jgi:midasin (ATPase involved in ribosome maturation)